MTDRPSSTRRRLDARGQVQGVGFRPFVYRLATRRGLSGSVANDSNGATIEIEGAPATLDAFEQDLLTELPPLARITELVRRDLPALGQTDFRIRASESDPTRRPEVTPDAAMCADCRRELLDPADRRYRYPFINCTNCGPRYSIIRDVPYDRPQTTMAVFRMCPACQHEYDDPADRRFHAQPNACAACGPVLELLSLDRDAGCHGDVRVAMRTRTGRGGPPAGGEAHADARTRRHGTRLELRSAESKATGQQGNEATRPRGDEAMHTAVQLLQDGGILAVKGIGGYHLACRADREDVVQRLRQRKLRDGKPLAMMVPDLATARRLCHLTPADEEALTSVAAPIVLAPKSDVESIAPSVAPGCGDYGVMLPYTPIHHLLFAASLPAGGRRSPDSLPAGGRRSPEAGLGPLVMTSANLAGQPLTYRDDDALTELADVADAILLHNREIFRPLDDSVVQTFRGEAVPIRRARGYAPRPVHMTIALPRSAGPPSPASERAPSARKGSGRAAPTGPGPRILAVGAELKATVCLLSGNEAVLSEHLGDLTRPEAFRHYLQAIDRLKALCGVVPEVVACDLHPRYLSTEHARRLGLPVIAVQHHHAHIASVMAEWGEVGPVMGLACDGAGYGPDHAVWGCEVLHCERGDVERVGHLEYYPLVGGDAAALETWRSAAALLRASLGAEWPAALRAIGCRWPKGTLPSDEELGLFERLVAGGLNAPPTSSLGRVFDAIAFLLGLCSHNRHEAEAAMAVEAAAAGEPSVVEPYAFKVVKANGLIHVSLQPALGEIAQTCERGEAPARIAARFHETVAQSLAAAARQAAELRGVRPVVLSGGCFANRRLLTRLVHLLESDGRPVRYHRHVPCGDGGISLGQAWVAAWRLASGDSV